MRNTIRTLTLAAGLCLPAAALAQPGSFTDLGTLTPGVQLDAVVPAVAINNTVWYKITLPGSTKLVDLTYLEVWCGTFTAGGTSSDSELALYDSAGKLLCVDDDDGNGLASQMSFGSGSGTQLPDATGTPANGNGRDQDLAAGVYYVGISYFGGSWADGFARPTLPGTALNSCTMSILMGTAPAAVEPVNLIDLGILGPTDSITQNTESLAGSDVLWYKLEMPATSIALGNYIDMDTEGTLLAPSNTTRLSMWGENGTLLSTSTFAAANYGTITLTDTTDGSNSLSQLTFGLTTPARPANPGPTAGVAYNGRDGALRAGTYYISIAGTGVAPSTTGTSGQNFAHTSTSLNAGPVTLNVVSVVTNTPPSGTGLSTPATIGVGDTAVARVTVIPGNNPVSTGLLVTLDTSLVDGGGVISLLDNGVAPDLVLGDKIFSGNVTAGPSANLALNALPFHIEDPESRVFDGTLNLTVSAPTNPTGVSTVSPAFGAIGDSSTVSVLVTKGQFPTSTVVTVTLDTSVIDGGGVINLLDNGVLPDVTLNDGRYTGTVTVGPSAGAGLQTMVATINDAQLRTANVNANFTVVGAPPACPSGDETFSFTNLDSEGAAGAVTNGVATFNPTGSYNTVAYRITGRFIPNTAFTAETRIRITQPSGAFIDTQPFTTSGPSGVPVDFTSVDIPVSCAPVANSGPWGVRIYESVTDAAVPDGVWANLCVSLVSGPATGDPLVWTGDVCVGDAGDLPATAQSPTGTGPLNSIVGVFAASDTDMYLVNICDIGAFSASTVGGTTADTQIWLFNLDGTGVIMNDDTTVPPATALQSSIDNSLGNITSTGNYYLAVSPYNRDAYDIGNALLFADTPFRQLHTPDGPGALNPVDHWTGTTTTTAGYTIALTGVCHPAGGPAGCNIADITEVGGTVEAPGAPDNQLTVDDIIVFVNAFGDGAGCPGVAPCNIADICEVGGTVEAPGVPDGQLTVDDLIVFFNAFSDGCV